MRPLALRRAPVDTGDCSKHFYKPHFGLLYSLFRPAAAVFRLAADLLKPGYAAVYDYTRRRVKNAMQKRAAANGFSRRRRAGSLLFQQRWRLPSGSMTRRVCELVLQRSADIGKVLLPQCVLFRFFPPGVSPSVFALRASSLMRAICFFFHGCPGSFPWVYLFAVPPLSIAPFGTF